MSSLRWLAPLSCAIFLAACASGVHDDFVDPEEAALFSGDSIAPSTDPADALRDNVGAPEGSCPLQQRHCPVTFSVPAYGEESMNLRGDFRGPDSWAQGEAMSLDGDTWSATVDIPWGHDIQYKFCKNNCGDDDWLLDPSKPTMDDGNGNTNNLLSSVTCNVFVCRDASK